MASPQENDKLEGASSLTGLFQAPSEEEQPEKRPSDGAAVLSSLFQPREPPKDTNGRPTHQREGSASLVGLFSPPSVESAEDVLGESTATIQHSNHEESSDGEAEENHDTKLQRLFHQSGRETPIDEDEPLTEETPLMTNYYVPFDSPGKSPRARDEDNTPKTTSRGGRKRHQSTTSQLPSIREMNQGIVSKDTLVGSNGSATPKKSWKERIVGAGRTICHELSQPTTWIGAFMYLLFQIVFALTMGAAITRPHGTRSMLGLFAKMAALGIMFGASNYWVGLSHEIPAMYPTVDLFTAPFMANIAAIVDEEIFHDPTITDPDEGDQIFLATFTTLASISMIISGSLLVFASVFKLANLGAFLPFPVICGFFAAVGVLTWSLGFKIDTGKGIGEVLFSGDAELVLRSFIHHLPSVIIAAIMKYLGPKNPFYVVAVVLVSIFFSKVLLRGSPSPTQLRHSLGLCPW